MSDSANTVSPTRPDRTRLAISLTSNETAGSALTSFDLLLDLDPPGAGLPPRLNGTGLITEGFESDRDGDGIVELSSLPRDPSVTGDQPNDTIGVWVGNNPGGIGDVISVVGCAGFLVPPTDKECRIEPDFEMDWHIHCPATPVTGLACNNIDGLITPVEGDNAYSGPNSLHWGHHFDAATVIGDSTKFRQMPAFMTNPINLTPAPEPGDLVLAFYHIAAMMDDNYLNTFPGQAVDYGDVHIRVDERDFCVGGPSPGIQCTSNADCGTGGQCGGACVGGPTPGAFCSGDADCGAGGRCPTDAWGFWDRLAPFQNVYDHIPYIWSTFGVSPTYCNFTPTDAGPGGAGDFAPRGVKELTCYPNGVWSHCGNPVDKTTIYQCDGPGEASISGRGDGLWVQSKFSMANYVGQRIQIRWIAQSWEFDCCSSSYNELGGWDSFHDDGWWIDNVEITGALERQAKLSVDTHAPAGGSCPAKGCVDSTPGSDHGFIMGIALIQAVEDGVIVAGEEVQVSAATTQNTGGCVGGVVQYRFFKDGVIVQDWAANSSFIDHPIGDAAYSVLARCSSDDSCTSATPASQAITVFTGRADTTELPLSVSNSRLGPDGVAGTADDNTTTLSWPSRPQESPLSGFDVFRGTRAEDGLATTASAPDIGGRCTSGTTVGAYCTASSECSAGFTCSSDARLLSLQKLLCDVPNGVIGGPALTRTDAGAPLLHTLLYYVVGHSNTSGAVTSLGLTSAGVVRYAPAAVTCP